ncbi:MAG: bifunctional DNA-formamidopyrimidine glycosylase/DNA-(apurinic or apyrimidinic site) lyase [Pseudomonadales bacterium]
MPELPEVETTRRGIAKHIQGQTVTDVLVRDARLRWPIATNLPECLIGQQIQSVQRRAKYLQLMCGEGYLLLHLGMSGNLRIVGDDDIAGKHDHVDIRFANEKILRYCDPRRFGSVLWQAGTELHPLLQQLGPEPLAADFHAQYLYALSAGKRVAIKNFLMDSHTVVGVGNIYANEALFRAGIDPRRAAGRIAATRYQKLFTAVKDVLQEAIAQGGTTLRDFVGSDGRPGYFRINLAVYGRGGQPCIRCDRSLQESRLGQRATVFCPNCQR